MTLSSSLTFALKKGLNKLLIVCSLLILSSTPFFLASLCFLSFSYLLAITVNSLNMRTIALMTWRGIPFWGSSLSKCSVYNVNFLSDSSCRIFSSLFSSCSLTSISSSLSALPSLELLMELIDSVISMTSLFFNFPHSVLNFCSSDVIKLILPWTWAWSFSYFILN